MWHPFLARRHLQFWCDNIWVVSIIYSVHSKVPHIMDLVRRLVLLSMQHNFVVWARHVPGVSNEIADALSHFQMLCFWALTPEVLTYATWGLAKNTTRAYSCGEKHFLEFCLMNRILGPDGDLLPAFEGTLVYFASYLARTVRPSTIKLYLAPVRNLHIMAGFNDPLKGKLLLHKVLRGILHYQGDQHIFHQPVPPRVLLVIHPVLQSWLSLRDFSMIWAAINLAFFAFLRYSEFSYAGIHKCNQHFDLCTYCIAFIQPGKPAAYDGTS